MCLMFSLACATEDDDPDADTSSSTDAASTGESSATTGSESSSSGGSGSGESSSEGSESGGSSSDETTEGSSGSSESGSGSSSTGGAVEPWSDCDEAQSCEGEEMCVVDPLPGEGPGLQWCALPCDPDGDGSECPDPPAGSEVTKSCFDLHDGTGVCSLDCTGGYECPNDMSCFNGNLCLYGES